MLFKYFNYHPEPGAGGGSITLADIDAEEQTENLEPKDNKEPDPQESEEEKLAREAEEQRIKDEQAEETQRLAEEAKLKEAENNQDPDNGNEEDEDAKFWDEVDALRGEKIEVDFGDIDPLSPEGVLLRERAVAGIEIGKFEEHLANAYPDAYAYFNHLDAGGTKEDFFKLSPVTVELPTIEQLETDDKIQERLIEQNLRSKGMNDKVIASVIKTARVEDELEEMAKTALAEETKKVEDNIKAVSERTQELQNQKTAAVKQLNTYIDTVVATGEIGGVIIPEKDRKSFVEDLKKTIRYDNGKFILVTELTNDNADDILKREFFSFKKGNLKELVEKQARSQNTVRLRKSITDNTKVKGSSGDGGGFVSLQDV